MATLFGRAKNLLTKYHMSADCSVGQRPYRTNYHMSADCGKTLLTKYHTSGLFGMEGNGPVNKVSHKYFCRAKSLLTKYHMSADCLVVLRPYNKVSHKWTVW